MKKIALVLVSWLFATVAFAQSIPLTGSKDVTISAGSGSPATVLPVSVSVYPAVLITPAVGTTSELRWVAGGSGIAAVATSPVLPMGGICYAPGAAATFVSFYNTGSSSATVHVTQMSICPPNVGFAGGGGSSGSTGPTAVSSFLSNGNYLNIPSVTATSANSALPAGGGTNIVINNTGGYKIIYQLSTSGASTVTQATADGVIQPGATQEVAVGTNTNIAYATTAAGLTSSMQITAGSGLWTGSNVSNNSVAQIGLNAPAFGSLMAGSNGTLLEPIQVTAPGVSAASWVLGIQGVTGGVPVNVTGSVTASFSQFAPNSNYATLAVTGTSNRVALPAGGGTTVAIYNTGSNPAFVQLGNSSVVATATGDQVAPGGFLCFAVGANTNLAGISPSGSTSLNLSGGGGGCAGSGGGGGGSSGGGTADANLTLSGSISTANNSSTGLVVQNYMNTGGLLGYASGGAELTGTATANSAMSTSGFSGWNSVYLECTGGGTAGTNWYEVDTSGGTGGTVQKRQATFTGPTFSGVINTSGATFLNVMADQYASGTLSCTARGSQNTASLNSANGPIPGNLSSSFSANSATTTRLIVGVNGLSIVLTGFSAWTDGGATTNGSMQLIAGTGATCATGLVNIGAAMNFQSGNGIVSSGALGQQFTLPPGASLCVTTTTTNTVLGNLTVAMR